MSFRHPKLLLREALGSYVNGQWISGARDTTEIQASIQPVVLGQDMQSVPEGRRQSDFIKIYSTEKLLLASDEPGMQSDIIVHEAQGYELTGTSAYASGVIPHYKYSATKLFNFTSEEDWLDGTIERR